MGGGDDTEVLLKFPFSKIYSFDFSNSVDRARKFIKDDRSYMFQASILGIPLPDRSFDFVFCHRVIQHTPDPADRKRTRLNSSHQCASRMPSSACKKKTPKKKIN